MTGTPFSRLLEPVGALVLDRVGIKRGVELLDVGTDGGGNVAIPAAQRFAFGAMFAHDHARAAAALVRACRRGGRIPMTTWVNDGFAGELFKLTDSFMPPPPPGVQPPPLWGVETHVAEVFGASGVTATLTRETVDFGFASVEDAVRR